MVIKVMVADQAPWFENLLKIILSAHPDIEVVATGKMESRLVEHSQTHPDLDLNGYSDASMDGFLATKKSKSTIRISKLLF